MTIEELKQNPALIAITGIALVMLLLGGLIFIPSNEEGVRRIGLFITILGPVILGMFNLITSTLAARASTASHAAVGRIETQTDKMVNGVMDEKIRNVVREEIPTILHEELVKHDAIAHKPHTP